MGRRLYDEYWLENRNTYNIDGCTRQEARLLHPEESSSSLFSAVVLRFVVPRQSSHEVRQTPSSLANGSTSRDSERPLLPSAPGPRPNSAKTTKGQIWH